MKTLISLVLVLIFLSCVDKESLKEFAPFTYSSPEQVGWESGKLQPLIDTVDSFVTQGKVMGAELVVIKDDKIIIHEASGWNDKENGLPLEKNSIYRVKSMTKSFVSISIMMLIEEGKIENVHDPVSKYIQEMNTEKSKNITIHQLMSHTSGLHGLGDPKTLRWDNYESLKAAVEQIGINGPSNEHGSFIYSDEGAGVAAYLVEKVSGQNLTTFFEERIFQPLNMNSTFFNPQERQNLIPRINKAYRYDRQSCTFIQGWSHRDSTSYGIKYLVGAFGILSSTLDYAKFSKMLMDAGYHEKEGLLSSSSIKLATKEHSNSPQGPYGYFFGLDNNNKNATAAFGHSGISGTKVWAIPEINTIVLYFAQSMGHHQLKEFTRTLNNNEYFAPYIQDTEVLAPTGDAEFKKRYDAALKSEAAFDGSYSGIYSWNVDPNVKIDIRSVDNKLEVVFPEIAGHQTSGIATSSPSQLIILQDSCEEGLCILTFSDTEDSTKLSVEYAEIGTLEFYRQGSN